MTRITVGFEVGSGQRVDVPLGHMVVCGQTQLSGKTTLLEAAASRSGRSVLAFRTKRGEGAFAAGARLPAYVQERADWQFVESILESTMRQRMKFERAWIMRACRGAKTLADVQRNVGKLQKDAKRGMDRDMYMMLGEYLSIVVPVLARLPRALTARIETGVNVVDLIGLPEEVQGLVIASWLGRVHDAEEGVICVIPESWKYLPQGRSSPVKLAATRIAREGAALGNLLWMDAQDLAGLEKEHQRGASVFCLGVQREMNEVKRNLALLPADVKKPKPEDVARLELGQFLVCQPGQTTKTYVWPAWMGESTAVLVAMGRADLGDPRVAAQAAAAVYRATPDRTPVDWASGVDEELPRIGLTPEGVAKLQALVAEPPAPGPRLREAVARFRRAAESNDEEDEMPGVAEAIEKMRETLDGVVARLDRALEPRSVTTEVPAGNAGAVAERSSDDLAPRGQGTLMRSDEDALFARFRERLLKEPKVLKILQVESRIEVAIEVDVIEVDGKTMKGRLALLVREGFFDEGTTPNAAWQELKRRGFPSAAKAGPGSFYEEVDRLAEMGFLYKEASGYRTAEGAKARVKGKV